ncbi:cytochrome c biogenesis protein CcsA [Nocardioides cheoyonin]|uniref:cytochrome c biogenesis protein CcsA n=1 Tax=Nocardioides cheoyonin TaxID=3156615 RepID=UPI0032B4F57D
MVRSWAARAGTRLGPAALGVAAVAAVLALVVAPRAAIQGEPQRLMYVHVPGAWTAFAAFACVALCSIAVLLRRPGPYDAVARAAAELGVAMTALAIAEGSLWGHSAWGVWWAWDPRLVTTALLLVSYVAYLALRSLPGDEDRVRRRAAVAGLVFSVEVPIAHFSVLWWRTLHQPPTVLRPSLSPPIAPLMLLALLVGVLAFTLAGAWYVRRRVLQLTAPTSPAAVPAAPAERAPVPPMREETGA